MNDRFRNLMKAHDHIVKCRTKEGKRIFIDKSKNTKRYIKGEQSI